MSGKTLYFGLFYLINLSSAYFFHEPSHIQLSPPDISYDFGFSLAYQSSTFKLVVGAPRVDLYGKVFTCPLKDVGNKKSITCSQIDINIDKLAGNYSRKHSLDQKFCLGATIAVTQDYIFTCAPLWTADLYYNETDTQFGAYGTCFIFDGNKTTRYNGMLEQYLAKVPSLNMDVFYGGYGWTLFSDDNVILMAKPSIIGSMSFLSSKDPYNETQVVIIDGTDIAGSANIGRAFTSGIFFNDRKLRYAFSMEKSMPKGMVAFLEYDPHENSVDVLQRKFGQYLKAVKISDDSIGSMFGAALHGVDLNGDGFTELLVGAPAQSELEGGYEMGAVHIYLGGKMVKTIRTQSNLCIRAVKDGSRFGSAIASSDLDEDNLPEIFISAPYEDNGLGSVYILSGHEINKLLTKTGGNKNVLLSDLNVQRISNQKHKTFGFSIHAIHDLDKNTGNALAVGAPDSGQVLIYRSIPSIKVTVSAKLKGTERVRELDDNITVSIVVKVEFPQKPQVISGKLFLTTNIIGNGAHINHGHGKETFNISKDQSLYRTDVLVIFNYRELGDYIFTASLESDVENLKRNDYHSSLVRLSPYSNTEATIDVKRRCKGGKNDCVPLLSMELDWSGGDEDHYVLGSSLSETMSVIVRNDGNSSYGSCAWIKITGAKIAMLECDNPSDLWYRCDLNKIEKNAEHKIDIRFDMSHTTNMDEKLEVKAFLYSNCASSVTNATDIKFKPISYNFNTEEIYVEGAHYDRNVTLSEIGDLSKNSYIDVHELYTVMNNGTVTWNAIYALITLSTSPWIKDYTIYSPEIIECVRQDTENTIMHNCTLNLRANSTVNFQTTVTIMKANISEKEIESGQIRVLSVFVIKLHPTTKNHTKSLMTSVYLQQDLGFAQSKNVIILASAVLAVVVWAMMGTICYQVGFFKREKKDKLNELKEEIRRQSTRRPSQAMSSSNHARENASQGEHDRRPSQTDCAAENISKPGNDCYLEVIEDSLIQETNLDSGESVMLIK